MNTLSKCEKIITELFGCVSQRVVSYLIASHHKFGIARSLSTASPEARSISADTLASKYQTTPSKLGFISDAFTCGECFGLIVFVCRIRNPGAFSAKGLTLPQLSTRDLEEAKEMPESDSFFYTRSIRVHVLQMILGKAYLITQVERQNSDRSKMSRYRH